MELRHLRYFLAVAEELHFARAAERLHIEQSPLSRAIRELEEELGAQLFVRTSRSTRLTLAGKLLMENAPRVLLALDQARESVKAAANGFHGRLRVALSDDAKKKPSEYALGGRYFQSIDLFEGEKMTRAVIDLLGDHVLMFGSDYPHGESYFPESVDTVMKWDLPEAHKRKLLWDNTLRFYGLSERDVGRRS